MMPVLGEIKRRKVFQVAVVYAVKGIDCRQFRWRRPATSSRCTDLLGGGRLQLHGNRFEMWPRCPLGMGNELDQPPCQCHTPCLLSRRHHHQTESERGDGAATD
jgi:hypothetical protein